MRTYGINMAVLTSPHIARKIARHASVALTLILSGCAATGPHSLVVDRFDYSAAIASSTNEQMLR